MKYIVHCNHDLDLLTRVVNEYLKQGWECQGGVSCCAVMVPKRVGYNVIEGCQELDRQYCQAMILHSRVSDYPCQCYQTCG